MRQSMFRRSALPSARNAASARMRSAISSPKRIKSASWSWSSRRGGKYGDEMKFGINFFPSFRPEDSTTADYYEQCIRIAMRADELGYSSIKTVEHSFYDYGGHSPNPCVFLSAGGGRPPRIPPITRPGASPLFYPPPRRGALALVSDTYRGGPAAGVWGGLFFPEMEGVD